MSSMRLKKGDMVQIIAGKDKGKSGKIISIDHKKGRVCVEGLNMITKHTKPSMSNQQGGIVTTEGPIDASNVMYLADGKVSRIGYVFDGTRADGKPMKKRVAKATGKIID
jgi:large subunit ribosomal protein L24